MTDKDIEQAISDYLLWLLSKGYTPKTCQLYRGILNNFRLFINQKNIPWDKAFSLNALEAFRQHKAVKYVPAVRGLSWYLYNRERIKEPIRKPMGLLPKIYEQYLLYYQQSHQSSPIKINHVRRVLASFNDYMQRHNIDLCALTIENLDMFLKAFNEGFLPNTCKTYRHYLRGFLKYLYHDKGVLKRNLAPLVVGAPLFSQAKLPKFLRPHEVQKLFSNLRLSTPSDIRTYAMVHLAYCLGLRPKEISSITLDDISFHKRVIKIRERKNRNPMNLPIPEHIITAIATYLLKVRPESEYRHLFLSLKAPYAPVSPNTVMHHISKVMKQAGLASSPYWLRHTYAQNLLETGASIYELKEMLGHNNIQSTNRYLHIHVTLMRKVLFDEEI